MPETIDKPQEALQDATKPAIPPPAYQETSSTYIEPDGFEIVESPETLSQEERSAMAGPSTAVLDEKQLTDTPSMLKGKGPALTSDPDETAPMTETTHLAVDEPGHTPSGEAHNVITVLPILPPAEEATRGPQVQFAEQQQEETPPSLPTRPNAMRFSEDLAHDSSISTLAPPVSAPLEATGAVPLKYIFTWNRPLLDFPTLEVKPADNATIPSAAPMVPPTASWRLNYHKKYHARLQRYTAAQTDHNRNTAQVGDFPFRQVAEFKFPEFIVPGVACGATVKFDMHEEEATRLGNHATARGKKPLPRVQKFLQCEGWFSTSFTMEIPVLDHLQASWRSIPRPKTAKAETGQVDAANETAIVERKTTDMEREAKKHNIKLVTISDMIETAKRTLNNETWTPYAPQQLVIESTGAVVATYQRASPFAKHAGVLTINQSAINPSISLPEFIEGMVIATTAMVGMQDRIGLASGLMEAASTSTKWSQEQWLRIQREWKDRKARRQSTSTHPYGNTTSKQQSANKRGEVGSEIVDDELGGAVSAEERDAARKQQMAWDESAKAKPAGLDEGLVGVLSVEEMEGARREHLAWEEQNRTNVLSNPASGPRQERKDWEEKPNFVYA